MCVCICMYVSMYVYMHACMYVYTRTVGYIQIEQRVCHLICYVADCTAVLSLGYIYLLFCGYCQTFNQEMYTVSTS
jgi:hypothetical protein